MRPAQVNALILAPLYSFYHLVADMTYDARRLNGEQSAYDLPDFPFVDVPRSRYDGDISMIQEACNTVRIHAAHGRSEELGAYLASIVEKLPTLPGCVHSALQHDEQDRNLWIIDVRWQSCQAMSDHFAQPSNDGLNGLLSNMLVRHVAFESDSEMCNLPSGR